MAQPGATAVGMGRGARKEAQIPDGFAGSPSSPAFTVQVPLGPGQMKDVRGRSPSVTSLTFS